MDALSETELLKISAAVVKPLPWQQTLKPGLHIVVTIAEHAPDVVSTSIANISCDIRIPAIITTMGKPRYT